MSNLGSSNTPISGESFDLPSGWSIEENGSNEVVITDSGGNTIGRRDETNGEWVFDSIVGNTLEATDVLNAPKYPTRSDVPDKEGIYRVADVDGEGNFGIIAREI